MSLRPAAKLHPYRGNVLTSAPSVEPVTAAELRTYLRETATGLPDSEAEDFITEARQMIEEHTGLALVTQSWRLAFDRWPNKYGEPWWDGVRQGSLTDLHGADADVELPRYPLQSITSVTVYDAAGTSTAVTVSNVFDVDTYRRPGRIGLKYGATWPVAIRPTNGVEIVYVAGYGDSASDVPAALRRAVKQLAARLYQSRGDDCPIADLMGGVSPMLSAYAVVRV